MNKPYSFFLLQVFAYISCCFCGSSDFLQAQNSQSPIHLLPIRADSNQPACATNAMMLEALQEPAVAARYEATKALIKKDAAHYYKPSSTGEQVEKGGSTLLTIPVVVHIVSAVSNPSSNISDEQIFSQITALNEIYRRQNENAADTRPEFLPVAADCEIEFCLAQRDPNGNPTTGITRTASDSITFQTDAFKYTLGGGIDAWDTEQYLNIWVVNRLYSGIVLGYAYLPNTAPVPEVDGIAVVYYTFGTTGALDPPYVLGTTTAHEVGHYLGLFHTWGQGNNQPDPDCVEFCILDDDVEDTPNSCHANFGCIPYINSCGEGTPGDLPDMNENYMDYSNDACQNIFTEGQKSRMRTVLSFGGFRYGLANDPLICTPIQQGNDDVKLLDIVSPSGPNNCTRVNPVIEIQNYGTTVLYTCHVTYTLDLVSYEYDWIGELAPFATTQFALPTIHTNSNTPVHELGVNLTLPNGNPDFNELDNIAEQGFATVAVGAALPLVQNFEAPSLPTTYNLNNADGNLTFELTAITNHSDNGTQSYYVNNFMYNDAIGTTDALTLPRVDLLNAPQPVLEFYVAYTRQDQNDVSDTLHISLSDDCAQSFHRVHSVWGDSLVTAPLTATPFLPTDTQWRRVVVPLDDYIGTRTLQARITQVRGNGNNLFIDNLGIYAAPQPLIVIIDTTANDTTVTDTTVHVIYPTNQQHHINIQPNPTRGMATLYYSTTQAEAIHLALYDLSGRCQWQQAVMSRVGDNPYSLPIQELPTGIYIVQINSSTKRTWIKLVVMD